MSEIRDLRQAAQGSTFTLSAAQLLAAYARGERDFSLADLRGADLYGANLHGADLYGARGIASISGVGKSRRMIYAYRRPEDEVIIVRAGCREAPTKDVIKAIQTDYGKDSADGKAYIKAVKLLFELVELQYMESEEE